MRAMLAAAARPVLGEPRKRAEAEPDGCEQAVEDDQREHHLEPPEDPAPERDPHLVVASTRFRRATTRRIRWAISSIESSETSITGQPSLRWMPAAYSSSS